MAEMQASVRSRENKRIEKETAEKKALLELLAAAGQDVTEDGVLRASDPNPGDPDDIRQEIRSWRRQRETSLKSTTDLLSLLRILSVCSSSPCIFFSCRF